MADQKKTGIYFYPGDNGHRPEIDLQDIISYSMSLPGIRAAWDGTEFPMTDSGRFVSMIKENQIERIIIAGETPGFAKPYFTKIMTMAGGTAEEVVLASFLEYNIIKKADNDRAKALIACALYGVPFETAAVPGETPVLPETLVIGGGIAGIQASLELADAGNKVYLVERSGTIGGYMATFDKTFPTLDCAACILTPKMVEAGQHPNIELMSYCEVKEVAGSAGNFKVKVLKKARHVNLSTCIGCGTCAEKCPAKVPSEFDSGTTMRKAIYIPFPQAVPNKYLIDAEHCTYMESKKCGVCVKFCPVKGCIDFEEKDEIVELNVGNIIVATGFKLFDARRDERFGYGKFPNVLTSLEFERLVNASGPTGGQIKSRTQDKKGNWIFTQEGTEPKDIALIHCVGSRDQNFNKYCSRVCCMYSLKLAHLVQEKLPKANVYEYYIDMRAFGKGYEEFYNRIKHEGVHIIRGRTAKIEEKNNRLMLRTEDILNDDLLEQEVDMVILAAGLEARDDAGTISEMLGLSRTDEGWFMEANSNSDPVNTYSGGISIAGVCQGPKDIPDTVAQASAAAARVIQSIIRGKISKSLSGVKLTEIESVIKEH